MKIYQEGQNQPVYYIPFVRITKEYKNRYERQFNIGDTFPIHLDNSFTHVDHDHINVEVIDSGFYATHIVTIPLDNVELFVKIVTPKFKLYDVVWRNFGDPQKDAGFRVYGYFFTAGDIRYLSGFCESTGFSNGASESVLTLATEEQKTHWSISYDDSLVKDANPALYRSLVTSGHIKEKKVPQNNI